MRKKKVWLLALVIISTIIAYNQMVRLFDYDYEQSDYLMENRMKMDFSSANEEEFIAVNEELEETDELAMTSSQEDNHADEYEENDSIESATYISPYDFYKYDQYLVEINANLDSIGWIIDVDYYYFVILTESVVSISCSSSSVFENFDFIFYTYDCSNVIDDEVTREVQQITSDFSDNNVKNYSATLPTGTYFIYLKGQQDYDSEYAIEYELILDVEVVPFEQSITTDSIVSSEYEGAIWISDYVPGNYIPLLDLDKEILFEQAGVQGLDIPDYTLRIMENITCYEIENQKSELAYMNGLSGYNLDVYIDEEEIKGVHVATYYTANKILRHILYLATSRLAIKYENSMIDLNQKIDRFEFVRDVSTNGLKIVAKIGGQYLDMAISIPGASKIIEYVSLTVLNAIFDIITPEISDNLTDMKHMFSLLAATLSMGITSQYETNYDYINSLPTSEVIFIPIYYYIRRPEFNAYAKTYISYRATAAYITKTSCYPQLKINVGNTISCDQEFDYFNRGKIYGLVEFGEITSIESLNLYDEDYHVHNYDENYTYINNTHHYAYCRCGSRVIRGHAVVANSQKCLQCKGNVDKGIVQMGLKTIDNDDCSYVLKNGVIVLSENDVEMYLSGRLNIKKKEDD